jgi:hypothetical protein
MLGSEFGFLTEPTPSIGLFIALPARDGQVIQIQSGRAARTDTVDLEVSHQDSTCPAEGEGGGNGLVDWSFDAVKPHRVVSHIAYAVARVADLNMVPNVRCPGRRITRSAGRKPFDDWFRPCAYV